MHAIILLFEYLPKMISMHGLCMGFSIYIQTTAFFTNDVVFINYLGLLKTLSKGRRWILLVAKTCHVAVSKPNRNSLKGLWGGTMAKQAEGCAVLRLSKAAARLLRVLRPGQNVPCSSFEAQ